MLASSELLTTAGSYSIAIYCNQRNTKAEGQGRRPFKNITCASDNTGCLLFILEYSGGFKITCAEIKIKVNFNTLIGYFGLFFDIIGVFLPWMNVFYYDYYYSYYYGWEFIGLFGIGIFSVIGSFLALIGLLKKQKCLWLLEDC